MLIIFDLDDTLIDTSGCLTPFKLQDVVDRMVEAGLHLPDKDGAVRQLKQLSFTSENSKEALDIFLKQIDADPSFFEIGVKELESNSRNDLPVIPLKGAEKTLLELAKTHQLALVTAGRQDIQGHKLKKAGIDSKIFGKIVVCEAKDKKRHYKAVFEELDFPPDQVIVCGDRIMTDLLPAKQLGCRTVQMKWGRGLRGDEAPEIVDHAISELEQLKQVLENFR